MDDVFRDFQYDAHLVPSDMADILQLASPSTSRPGSLNQSARNRVAWLYHSAIVRSWLTVDESSFLLVNGNGDTFCQSTTVFCANVLQSLLPTSEQQQNSAITIIPLAYFGTKHQDYRRDAMANPSEVAMSLLLQLIDRYRGFGPEALRECLESTNPDDVDSICKSLGRLIRLLPDTALVYVIIEGLQAFSAPGYRESQMRALAEILLDMFLSENRVKIKGIFTSPTRARYVEDLFDFDQVIDVPSDPAPMEGEPFGQLGALSW